MTTPSTGTRSPGRTRTQVADDDLVDRDLALAAVAQHAGGVGAQLEERLHRSGRLALGARLEPAAEEDEADDHGRRVEVGLMAEPGAMTTFGQQRDEQRVAVCRQGAHGDERVHVRLEMASAAQCGDQEAPAEHELDDRGGDEEPAIDVDHRPRRAARPEHDGHHRQADARARPPRPAAARVRSPARSASSAAAASSLLVSRRSRRGRRRSRRPRWSPRSRPIDHGRVEANRGPLGGQVDAWPRPRRRRGLRSARCG